MGDADPASQCGGMQLLLCFSLYGLTLFQRDPVNSPALAALNSG